VRRKIQDFIAEQSGQDLVEYGLLAALIALGSVAALSAFQGVISTSWSTIASMLSD